MCKCKSKTIVTKDYFVKITYIGETGEYIGVSGKSYGIFTKYEEYYVKKVDYDEGVKNGIFL